GAGDFCALYPIALPLDALSGLEPGTQVDRLPRGTGPGNFSWLTWAGNPSAPVLANSLVPPGDSYTYINPDDDSDWLLTPGDWTQGAPGAMNSSAIRDNLDALLGTEITVPVWSEFRGQGNNLDYRVINFARVRLLDYRLPGNGWFTFEFLGFSHCYNRAPEALVQQLETEAGTALDVELEGVDPDEDELTFEVTTPPEHGRLEGEPPLLRYIPDPAFTGEDNFEFIALDDYLASPPARVTIQVVRTNLPPSFISTPITSTVSGRAYQYQAIATDPDEGDALTYTIRSGPDAMTIDAQSGLVAWQPGDDDIGFAPVVLEAFDPFGASGIQSFDVEVFAQNSAPVATPGAVQTEEGIAVPIELAGTDREGDMLTFRITEMPARGRIIGTPPALTYVPDANYDGLDLFRFTAFDGELESIPAIVEIEILGDNDPPRIISEPVTPHVLGTGLSDPEPQVLRGWELAEFPSAHGGSPNWSFSGDGLTATQIGNNPPSTLLGDFNAVNKRIEGTWLVATLSDDDFIGFVLGYQDIYKSYLFEWKKNAQGNTPRGYSFNIYDLPSDGSEGAPDFQGANTVQGMSLHSNDVGWISHRLYDYTIDYRPGDIKVSIREGGQILEEFQITDDRLLDGRFGIFNFSQSNTVFTVKISDLDGGNVIYRLIEGPAGATIDETTGLIRWVTAADQVGRHPVVIDVEDEFGATSRQAFDLVVLDEQPVITSDPLETAFSDEPYRYLVTALDPNPDDVLTYSLVDGPDGAAMDPVSGLLEWIPPGTGTYDFTVRVTDALGLSGVQAFSVEVIPRPANEPP
ncbi:MAG: putative Ig domain-containing protein, partial [Xanthomonadaceae bacterium]|nr:putative Ig domain-containing protein [Xanthomonadaceae bacterium]